MLKEYEIRITAETPRDFGVRLAKEVQDTVETEDKHTFRGCLTSLGAPLDATALIATNDRIIASRCHGIRARG